MGESTRSNVGKTPNDTLIEHADRLWHSECENASRIANHRQLLGGAVFVIIGLSTFGSEWFYYIPSARICPIWVTAAVHCLLGVAIVLLAATLAVLYAAKKLKPTANTAMEIDDADVGRPSKSVVFSKTYLAYLELEERNAKERIRLNRAEAVFAWAIGFTFLAILLYIFGSLDAKMWPRQSNGGINSNIRYEKVAKGLA